MPRNFASYLTQKTNRDVRWLQCAVWPAGGFRGTELRDFDGTAGYKWEDRSSAASLNCAVNLVRELGVTSLPRRREN